MSLFRCFRRLIVICAYVTGCVTTQWSSAASIIFQHPSDVEVVYDDRRMGVELKLGVEFLRAVLAQQMNDVAMAPNSLFESSTIVLVPQPGPVGSEALGFSGSLQGRLKERFLGNPVDVGCQFAFSLSIADQPLTESSLRLKHRGDLFQNCTVGGDAAKAINLGKLLADALNSIQRWIPDDLLQKAIGKDLFSNAEALDRFCRMWLVHALVADIRLGTSNCKISEEAAFCLGIYWPAEKHEALLAGLLSELPAKKGKARGVASSLVTHWRSYAPVAPAQPAVACGSLVDVDGPKRDGIPSKAACETGDMALFGGLLCASGEESGCRLVQQAQGSDGRFWRSPRLREQPNQDNEFSGDMTLGVIHWGVSSKDAPSIAKWRTYMATHVTMLPPQTSSGIPFARVCENDSNGTCNVGADNWRLLNELGDRLGLQPTGVAAFDSAYSASIGVLPLYAMVNESGFRLHLVAAQIWAYQRMGITSAEVVLASKVLAARQPTNPFYVYLALGPDQTVQDLIERKCPKLGVVPAQATEWAWERDSAENASARSMGWDCIFMANLLK